MVGGIQIPTTTGLHLAILLQVIKPIEYKNGSTVLIVMNLKPVEIEHNYAEVSCIPDFSSGEDSESNKR
jgi:hypothetical protein